MARGKHTSPQRTRTNKSRKSVLKTFNLIKQNELVLKSISNVKLQYWVNKIRNYDKDRA